MRFTKIMCAVGAVGIVGALALGSATAANAATTAPAPKASTDAQGDRVRGEFNTWTNDIHYYGTSWGAPASNGSTVKALQEFDPGLTPKGGAIYTFPAPGRGLGPISPASAPDRCLQTTGTVRDTRIVLNACNGSSAQQWRVEANGTIRTSDGGSITDRPGRFIGETGTVLVWYDANAQWSERLLTSGLTPVIEIAPIKVTGPTSGSIVTIPRPPISGTGEPGASVVVEDDNGTTVGTTTVGADGKWSLTPSTDFANGSQKVTATQTKDGNTTTDSTSFTVAVPVIEGLTASVVSKDQDAKTAVIGGEGHPGAELEITNPDNTKQTVKVGSDGTWTATIPNLKTGDNPVKVTQTVGDNVQEKDLVVAMDEAPLTAEVISINPDDQSALIGGDAEPGAQLVITNPDNTKQTITVPESGKWEATIPGLKEGDNPVKVEQTVGDKTQSKDLVVTLLPSPIVNPAIAGGAGLAAIAALGTAIMIRRNKGRA